MTNQEKMNNDDMPFKGTMEMLGVNPEDTEKNLTESREYKDIGAERMAATTERVKEFGNKVNSYMSRGWNKIKSFGSATKETGKSAITYAFAAPEMIRDAKEKVKEGALEGATYMVDKANEGLGSVRDKMEEGAAYIGEKGEQMYEGVKDAGATVAGRAFEEVVYVGDKAKEGYDKAINFGKEKYAGLKERASDAKAVFNAAVEEARRRRIERVSKSKDIQKNPEYASALNILLHAKEHLAEVEARIRGEGIAA